ncbi:putative bifunctional diguanylate cyclase/phosphodiesterase [Sphingomonas sp.]|uniref:putative bifunctional diguanylate cyclase/phosphodiesterase n=1 Tax=Sphingomonas sp. TaxID=28214 RepID=UPI0039C9DFDE
MPASGQVVIVEMDAASVAAIRRWPWPREHYATVLDRLRTAGAASVTFDVDFSSASSASGDTAFAAALARADGLVALPTFAQQARSGDARSIDALPLPAFRPNVALASVSMQPDPDGVVRRAPFGTITAGQPRPSLSSFMAHRSGVADTFFPINFAVDHRGLPHLSFVAVEQGRFDPAQVRGRDVLIGATAVEMGDRYATPHWGVIPGVILQALAAETLLPGVPGQGSGILGIILAALLGLPIVWLRSKGATLVAAVAAPLLIFAAAVSAQVGLHRMEPLAPGLALIVIVGLGRAAMQLVGRFEQQRCFDEETRLPNRHAMVRDLGDMSDAAIVVAAIGNYTNVVALMGERAGHDLVLRIADRLRLAGSATVYRLSDSQLAVPSSFPSAELFEQIAGLRAVLTQPVEIVGRRTDAATHLGVSDASGPIQDRLVAAGRAADEAIASGVFWLQSSVDQGDLERRLVLMGELDQAMADGQIEVHYQPKLSLKTDTIVSVEALVRWRHPERGMLRPDLFVPLAEQADRIGPLTMFVLDRVIDDLARWQRQGFELTAAVNLSALLIAEPSFSAALDRLLDDGRVPPTSLIFEVTESATLADPEQAAANLRRFRDRGVAVSLDDYGTGQSTLTYLRQLPLSELKIDRSFVQHAHVNRSDELMVRSTIDLAHNLGLKVVAEGIEDEGCLTFLRNAGCDMAQGYFIGRPMPSSDLVRMLEERTLAA